MRCLSESLSKPEEMLLSQKRVLNSWKRLLYRIISISFYDGGMVKIVFNPRVRMIKMSGQQQELEALIGHLHLSVILKNGNEYAFPLESVLESVEEETVKLRLPFPLKAMRPKASFEMVKISRQNAGDKSVCRWFSRQKI